MTVVAKLAIYKKIWLNLVPFESDRKYAVIETAQVIVGYISAQFDISSLNPPVA